MLTHKTVLITGANGGLGTALLKEALAHNAKKIYACVRDPQKAQALTTLDPRIEVLPLVTTDLSSVQHLASVVDSIDILINNAGMGISGSIEEASDEEIQLQMGTNFMGTIHMASIKRCVSVPIDSWFSAARLMILSSISVMLRT